MSPPLDILLVSSGLGSRLGGIGCVSQNIHDALEGHWQAAVVTAAPHRPKVIRRAALWASLLANRPPRLVLYEHRGLARVHPWVPWSSRTRYAILLHGFEIWRTLPRTQRRIIEGANCLLAFSQTTVSEARRHNPWLPPTRVVHLGVDLPERQQPVRSTVPLIVFVSRVEATDRSKSHDEILDAWPTIRAAVPSARFVAIGGGSDVERLRQRVRSERLEGVHFTGFVTAEERNHWVQQASAAFALARYEGFGLANVEAVGAGLPLIGLPDSVLDELFPKNVGVRFVRSLRACDIAETTIELLRDPQGAAELGRRGQEYVLGHYTREHFRNRFLAIMGTVMESGSTGVSA